MRTLVDIDEKILKEAMEIAQTSTKKETIRLALEELIRTKLRQKLKGLSGSEIVKTTLSDLRSLRNRRQKEQRNLLANQK
ncbi:MAG: type II toxin-antitoxin system VapB family antitoxin [Thermodesulfobacteriota bacterium]